MAGLEIPEDLDLSNLNDKQKIVLLDKLFFKILASESDLDFQNKLHLYLPKLLQKLAGNDEVVRRKVMEILVHINKRIKSRPAVTLPISDFINQFNFATANSLPFITNFSLIYIKMGFVRLQAKEKADIIENLLNCLDGKTTAQQFSILSLIVDGIRYLELNVNDNSNKTKYGLENSPKLRKLFIDYLFYYLLLPYESMVNKQQVPQQPQQQQQQQQQQQEPNQEAAAALQNNNDNDNAEATNKNQLPACLCESIYKQMKADVGLDDVEELEQAKAGILKFLSLGIFTNEEIVFHFIIATSDIRYNVVRIAELHIKRISSVDWNDQKIITRLLNLMLGDKLQNKASKNPELNVEPANTRIRLKLMPYLFRSQAASNILPQSLQLVFDCLFGTIATNKKIKHNALQFVHDMTRNCDLDKLLKIGGVLVQGLNKLIKETTDDNKLRGLSYVAIGKFAKRIPNVISNDITLVHNFFKALATEDSDTKLHIQEALVLMIEAFRNAKTEEKDSLLKLLYEYLENDVPQCRSMATKYAFEIFENDHLESRYLLLLAASDVKEDIRQDCAKYLRKTHDYDGVELKIAKFDDLVTFITDKGAERIKANKAYTIGTRILAFNADSYFEALVLLRLSLSKSANLKPQIIDLKSIDSIKDEAPLLLKYIETLASNEKSLQVLNKYVNLIKEYAIVVGNALGLYLLLEICAISPFVLTKSLIDNIEWIKSQMFSVKDDIRNYAAELWSIVVVNNIINEQANNKGSYNFESLFTNLINMKKTNLDNSSKSFEHKYGTLLCVGFTIGKFYYVVKESLSKSCSLYSPELKELIESVGSYIEDQYLNYAAIYAFGEIGRNGPLIMDNDNLNKVIDKMHHKLTSTNEGYKIKEKAAFSFGYMCVGDKEFKLNKRIMDILLNSSQAKQVELHMAYGEALLNCALGPYSPASRNIWTCREEDWNSKVENEEYLEWLLNELLNKYIENANPFFRQAASFWLLVVLKKCSSISKCVLQNLLSIQDAFINRLGENDEVTQEVASKAISLIYTLATQEQRDNLVSKLVDTLSGNKKAAAATIKIKDENEEILKLGNTKTPDGANLGTYKELCSLASDLNKPDLIYQFMNLAHHNSIWNTRKGAAFGFSTIAKLASDQLQSYLPNLVPKLYRYQFDPNPKIQQSMVSIWNSVIQQDNKKIIDQYLGIILDDVEKNMLSPLWRVRESCCLALCDLLKGGRNLEPISTKFGKFWSLLFKLVDDIKESVRIAAEMALKSVNRVTITYSSAINNISVSEATINSVLPILMKDGIHSSLTQIREISVKTILELTKLSSNAFIKPYIVELIPNLLETLSGYEPSDLNYVALKLNSQDLQEKLDLARISASKNTPMIEIINHCLQFIDEKILAELIPKLLELIRKSLGVSTKAGLCQIICTLIDQSPQSIAPYAGKLMAALVNAIANEINKTSRKYYCNTLGYIVKIAKESSIENLLNKLYEWYFDSKDSDEGIKLSCALTLLAIAQNNNELIGKYAKKCVPFVFFAMHEQNEQSQNRNESSTSGAQQQPTVWQDVWDEITTGPEYAIRTYLNEILQIIKVGIDHQSWKMRMQSAMAVCTICNKLQSKVEIEYLNEILNILNSALNTRTWSGKEKVLLAVSSLFLNCKSVLKIDNELVKNMIKNIFKEANKQSSNVENNYKIYALRCLADIIQFSSSHFNDSDFEMYWSTFIEKYFEETIQKFNEAELKKLEEKQQQEQQQSKNVEHNTEETTSTDTESSETIKKLKLSDEKEKPKDEEDEANNELFNSLRIVCLESFGKCWPYSNELQEKYLRLAVYILADYISKSTWNNQLSIIKSYFLMFEKWTIEFEDKNILNILNSIYICAVAVINCIAKTKYSNLKRDGLSVLEKIMNMLINEKQQNEKWEKLISSVDNSKYLNNIIDSLRVLFEELSIDTNSDIKEKSKILLKLLNSNFK